MINSCSFYFFLWSRMKDKKNNIILIINAVFILFLLWIWYFLYYFYTELNNSDCKEWEILHNKQCMLETISCDFINWSWSKTWEWNDYSDCRVSSCSWWFELIDNTCLSEIRQRTIVFTWSFAAKSHTLWSYQKIKINDTIQNGTIKITIDFQELYKNGLYDNFIYWWKKDWSHANPDKFWLFFFLWKWNQGALSPYTFGYGWFFDVLTQSERWILGNSSTLWLNWLVPWNQIIDWYSWEMPIENNIIFATNIDEWRSDYQFKRLNLLDYINNSIWSNLYIGWYLSNMDNKKWWEITQVKSIEIQYMGKNNAIQFVE